MLPPAKELDFVRKVIAFTNLLGRLTNSLNFILSIINLIKLNYVLLIGLHNCWEIYVLDFN